MRPLLTLLPLLLLAAPAAHSAQPAEPAMVLRGKVVDMTGAAVPRARFTIEFMKKRSSASVDRSGAFALMIPLPTPERLRSAACSLRVFATTKGMRLVLPNGDPALSVHLRVARADSSENVVARSNDERVAAMAALAVATRRPLAEVEGLRMMGLEGERVGDPPSVGLPHVAQVAVTPLPPASASKPADKGKSAAAKPAGTSTGPTAALPSPAPAASTAKSSAPKSGKSSSSSATKSTKPPAKSSSAAKPSTSGTTSSAGKSSGSPVVTVSPPADPAPPPSTPAASAPSDCTCRIKGTVELDSNPPPTGPVGVVVWVDGSPNIRGSVELALGSPRPFELLDVPCGTTQLRVQVSAERSYLLQSPGAVEGLSCTRGGLIQPRIILVPRKGF